MNRFIPGLIALTVATTAFGLNLGRVNDNVKALQANAAQRQTAPPAQQPALEAQRQQLVAEIRGAADSEPKNFQAQYAVSRGLLSSGEEAHATVYADKAVDLATASGDKKAEAAALTLAAVAYNKVGEYEAATDRAKRALWIEPKNSTALGVLMTSKDRVSKGAPAAKGIAAPEFSRTQAPLPTVTAATSGSGRSQYPNVVDGSGKPIPFMSADAQKAAKLLGEGQRKWVLDRKAALRLFDEAIAADAKNVAARAARARARLETGDYAGALEDAEVSLAGGPSGEAFFVKGAALHGLGRDGEEMLAAFKAAAELDSRYAADYQSLIAKTMADGKGGSAQGAAPAMLPETKPAPNYLMLGAGAALLLAVAAGLVLLRRRSEDA